MKYLLAADGNTLRLKIPGEGRSRAVYTVSQACSRLGISRRQVYRLLKADALPARAKILGEWLLDKDCVDRLARAPRTRQPLPRRFRPLFPEYDLSSLNAGRDRMLVQSRILEQGTLPEASWLLRRYGRKAIASFVREEGERLLSARSLKLWSLFFHVRPSFACAWRKTANPWRNAGL